MIITKELILTVLIALGIGKYSESQSPRYYEMITETGKIYNIKVDKKSKYACPLHCAVDHYHQVLILDDNILHNTDYYTIKKNDRDDIYVNAHNIVEVNEIATNKNNKGKKLKKINIQTYLP